MEQTDMEWTDILKTGCSSCNRNIVKAI